MRFALMHVDQSIELFLKERVRAGGKSIFRPKSKETISMWEAYSILQSDFGVSVPEKANLEILHDERNKIQHGSSSPSADDAAFHVNNAMEFIKRFCRDELKVDLADHLTSEVLENFDTSKATSASTP